MSISVPLCEPIVIQDRTRIGIYVVFYELSHRTLGKEAIQGLVQVQSATAANGTAFLRLSGTSIFTFPPNVLTFN